LEDVQGTVEDVEKRFEEYPEAARILEERFGEIFEDYEIRLREMNSLLVVGDGTTPEQLETNARSVLRRASKVLRGEEYFVVIHNLIAETVEQYDASGLVRRIAEAADGLEDRLSRGLDLY
jgi:hypothetical protein